MAGTDDYFSWQSPQTLLAQVDSDSEKLGEEWRRRAGRDFREAFIAARLAKFLGAEAVKLLSPEGKEPTPDFAIRLQSNEFWYETTEIDRPGRQRGAEPILREATLIADNEWLRAHDYLEVLRKRTSAKASKQYRKCDGLVVYDNAWPIADPEVMTTEWWRSGTEEARARFTEVWSFDGQNFTRIT